MSDTSPRPEDLQRGDVVLATVATVAPFGMYLDYQGASILVNAPDVTWAPPRYDPADAPDVGEQIHVQILNVSDDGRIAGSIRALHPASNPWRDPTAFQIGRVLAGRVEKVVSFGYLVDIYPGVDGLLARESTNRTLSKGDLVAVRIVEVEVERQRIQLELAIEDE